jgi:NAD(P)-dependent dehydrogenase (short-subunit alcohol dehydrogenase family)
LNGVAVITGTTHGIGRLTSRELASAGFTVLMLCRNLAAARLVREEIVAQVPRADIQAIHCDLASFASVRACASTVRDAVDRISVLINNAGVVSVRRRMSVDGFELTFATNHLGPFLLTSLLLDRMTAGGRIINIASHAHYRGKLELDHVTDSRSRYSASVAYSQSKLANVMHTFALARRLTCLGITANCLHPGVVATNLLPRWLRAIKPFISRMVSPGQAAQTCLYLAMARELAETSGCYFDESHTIQPVLPLAANVELQEALWQASAAWTGAGSEAPGHTARLSRRFHIQRLLY